MKKWFLLFFPLNIIFATETRINTLGGVPYFIDDESNVKIYPATITDFSNRIIGEITNTAVNFFADFKIATIGIGINSDTVPSIVKIVMDKVPFKRFSLPPMLSLYLGRKIINFSIGVKISMFDNYYKKGNFLHSIELRDITIGSKITLPEALIDFFIGRKIYSFESKSEIGGAISFFTTKDKPSFEAGIRFLLLFSPNIIFGINYRKIDVSYKNKEEETNFITQFTQGYGAIRLTPYKNFTTIFGILGEREEWDTLLAKTEKDTIPKTDIIPKIVIGMETNLTDWLKLRIGCNKSYYSKKSEEKIRYTKFNLAMGWALSYKNFELDVMGNDLPLANQSVSLSLSYKFNSLF